ncbi:MAG: MFS family permease [Gammaproteobacteria bacterium]|jgi:MFS family permease
MARIASHRSSNGQRPNASRNFRALLLGAACNSFGFFGEQVVVGYVVFELTESSIWVGVSLALYFAPMFFFGLASGAIADWASDRRILIRRTEMSLGAILAVMAIYIETAGVTLAPFLLLCALSGSGLALHQTLRGAIAFDLAGPQQILSSLGKLNLCTRLGQLAGAIAAGFTAREAGVGVALALLALVHVLGAVFYRGFSPAVLASSAGTLGFGANLREFYRELRTNRVLAILVTLTAGVEVLGFSFVTALPQLARERFEVGADGLGTLHSARAFGGILAALVFAFMFRIQPTGSTYVFVVSAFGIAVIGLCGAPYFWSALVALAAIAALAVATDVLSQSMMQLSVADAMRGRAMGVWVFAIGAAPLGHLELGFLVDQLGVADALLVNGCMLVTLALVAYTTLKKIAPRGMQSE